MAQFRIQSHQGIDFGVFEGADAQEALDNMARDAGYKSHAHACEENGEQGSWTTNRYEFIGGAFELLVSEVINPL